MNKIPFTSQNPYAFYAKTIDSYDTETNTRQAKRKKALKRRLFSFPPVFKWETPVLVTVLTRLPNSTVLTPGCCSLQRDCAAMQCCQALVPRAHALGFLRRTHAHTHTDKNGTRVIRKPKHKLQAYSYFKTAKYNWHMENMNTFFRIIDISQVPVQINKGTFVLRI